MIHLGDITTINGAEIPLVDVVTGGSPCTDLSLAGKRAGLMHADLGHDEVTRSGLFMDQLRIIKEMRERTKGTHPRFMVWENVCFAKDTFVACVDGYKNIQDIKVGDRVKTLSGCYMPVAKTHKHSDRKVMRVRVSGGEDVIVTPNHPFYARIKTYKGNQRTVHKPQWVPAERLTGKHLIGYKLDIPTESDIKITEAEAWTIGRWLADGSVDRTKSNARIFISTGLAKEKSTYEKLSRLPYPIRASKPHPTAINFNFTSSEFDRLIIDAGVGAGNKRVPPFVFNLPLSLQQSVLDGYISGDGYIRARKNNTELAASTASRELAYGIARLIRNCHRVSVNITKRKTKNGLIDGRIIYTRHPCYVVAASLTNKVTRGYCEDGIMWQPVKSVVELDETSDVWNLSVEGDHTYGANDILVHNCGAFSSNSGDDFRIVLEETARVSDPDTVIPRPPGGVWRNSGAIMGGGFSIAWRVFDAQFWGVPQRRRRIYLVADFGGGSASEILFEREGLRRNTPQSISEGQGAARSVEVGTGKASCIDHVITTGGKCTAQGPCIKEEQSFTLKASGAHAVATGFDMYNQEVTGAVTRTLKTPAGGGRNPAGLLFAAGVVSKGDGDCFLTPETHTSLTGGGGQAGQGYPCVLTAGFDMYNQEVTGAVTRTLKTPAGGDDLPVVFENHSQDTRYVETPHVAQTVSATYGMGGNNQPFVVESPKLMKMRSGKEGGGKGPLIQDNLSGTLTVGNDQTLFEPVCYGISAYESNSMKSDNPHSGVYEADTSRTIDLNGGNPACNQGGIAIVEALPFNTTQITSPVNGNNPQWGDACHTLAATDHAPAVCTVRGVDGYNSALTGEVASTIGINVGISTGRTGVLFNSCGHGEYEEGVGTLRAKGGDCGGGSENLVASSCFSMQRSDEYTATDVGSTQVASQYKSATDIITGENHTVRRLTPTECARLMGFPDDWGHLAPFNPEDAEFWEQVRKTYAEINGKTYRPVKDIKKWYDKLHTDSAEYKMWGNGIALPNAEYVLEGLALQGVKTLGSLFDGSGGFPLAGIKCGIKPIWASEIEPYPIAVTKSKSWLWG